MAQRGVGVIGSGPGVSALHLPTLERLGGDLVVVHVADSGSGRAARLAERSGARASSGIDELLADPAVEVVAVCSPPDLHARHVLAAVRAGKKGVLCEKPLATTPEEAAAVIEACQAAGTVLVVGTNHSFDPAWTRAKHHLLGTHGRPQSWTVTIALPPNGRYHDLVTESVPPSAAGARALPDLSDPDVAAGVVRQLVLGLAVHDLPALRDFAPRLVEVVFARPVAPIGYQIGLIAGDVLVQLNAVMLPGGADALWRVTIGMPFDEIEIDFLPAFVHAGSAAVTVTMGDGRVARYPRTPDDGYVMEWRALVEALDDDSPGHYDELLDDALFAIRIADAAAEAVRAGSAR
jgi:hypothetical protein